MEQDETRVPAGLANRARDHLANERTFLAWVRTALGLIGLGFVLARMGLFLRQIALTGGGDLLRAVHAGHEFLASGVVFLLLGTGLAGWSGRLYQQARLAIDAGRYEPATRAVLTLTVVVVTGGVAIVALVLWSTLAAPEGS